MSALVSPLGPSTRKAAEPDPLVRAYMREVGRHPLMTPEQEREAGAQVVALRVAYWRQILAYAPLADAVAEVARADLVEPLPKEPAARAAAEARAQALEAACALVVATARAVRDRDRRVERDAFAAATLGLATLLAWRDQESVLAGRVVADLARLGAGEDAQVLRAHVPRRGSRPFAEHVAAVRACGARLRTARNRFARANLRLVVRMAHTMATSGMAIADLIQEGNLGLLKAIDRFDPGRGVRFSTFGCWWIRHALSRAIADRGRTVRLPVHIQTLRHKAVKARAAMLHDLGRDPTDVELAARLEVAVEKIEAAEQAWRSALSLDAPYDISNGDDLLGDRVAADEPNFDDLLDTDAVERKVHAAVAGLDPRDQAIIAHRFGLGGAEQLTLAEIGEIFDLSRERIRQLEALALQRMRAAMGAT
jgi:RNA polymerase primary sigma factor